MRTVVPWPFSLAIANTAPFASANDLASGNPNPAPFLPR